MGLNLAQSVVMQKGTTTETGDVSPSKAAARVTTQTTTGKATGGLLRGRLGMR